MMYKGAIVIQGPSLHVIELKNMWKGCDIIWSTWKGQENQYDSDDVVVFNEKPSSTGTGNVALQQKTVLTGVSKAKELGYERVFKWRSDMIPMNAPALTGLLDLNAINMFFYHVANGGYYVDYFMEGTVDNIYDMWDFDDMTPPFAERALTNNIRRRNLKDIVFIGRGITPSNDILWIKKNLNLSSPLYQGSASGFITTEIEYD